MKPNKYTELPLWDKLKNKVLIYYQTVWAEKKFNTSHYKNWLNNFVDQDGELSQKLNAMYLLSKFMYFGQDEIRELLLAIYRDKFKYSIVEKIRKDNANTLDFPFIESEFQKELENTRFVSLGNASESGGLLLYYFRQVSKLSTKFCKNESEIYHELPLPQIIEPSVTRYIFIDDFCGSGETALDCYSLIESIKNINPFIEVDYFVLFGIEKGLGNVKRESNFDRVEAIYKLDSSFKCFEDRSRYFVEANADVDKLFCKNYSSIYGTKLVIGTPIEGHPLGFDDGQLLISFSHNTPDNTLPIIWGENEWTPSFKRFIKVK
jgi:hypothetical protein